MKILKSAAVAITLAVSMGTFSTSALAECEDGRTCFEPAQAVDMTVAEIMKARHAIDNGNTDEALAFIKAAINANKEINANDVVDRNRQKAAKFLKKARAEIRKAQFQVAEEHLKTSESRFKALKGMI